jgi:predicted transcriptional regulator
MRQKILYQLIESPKTITEIAKINSISPTESFRHLKKLEEVNFVEKIPEGHVKVTTSGYCALEIISAFDSISKLSDHINDHQLEFLPSSAIQNFRALRDCVIITNVVSVKEKLREIIKGATNLHYVVATQLDPDLVEYKLVNKINLKTQIVLGDNSLIPERVHIILKEYLKNSTMSKNISVKKIKRANFFLCLSETEGGIAFYDLNKNMNMNSMMYGNTPEFLDWCMKLFEDIWSNGEDISIESLF